MDDAIRTVQRLVFGEAALYGGVLRRLLRGGGSIVAFCRRLPLDLLLGKKNA